MVVLERGVHHYHAICHSCHTEALTDHPWDRTCPCCGDLMVVFELQKPMKMVFVEAYSYGGGETK